MTLPNHPLFDRIKMMKSRIQGRLGGGIGKGPASKLSFGMPNPSNKIRNMHTDRRTRAKSKGNKNL